MGSTPWWQPLASAGSYGLLFLLGVALGVTGSFQYSRGAGPVPVAALLACLVLLVACWQSGAGLGTALGGLAVALGWLLASFVLTLPTQAGSVLVTDSATAQWYLYGGAVSAATGVVLGMRRRRPRFPAGPPAATRPGGGGRPGQLPGGHHGGPAAGGAA